MKFASRAMIKDLRFKGIRLPEIFTRSKEMYDQDTYTEPDMRYWLHQLKVGRTSMQAAPLRLTMLVHKYSRCLQVDHFPQYIRFRKRFSIHLRQFMFTWCSGFNL
jgi:hypothetical protein